MVSGLRTRAFATEFGLSPEKDPSRRNEDRRDGLRTELLVGVGRDRRRLPSENDAFRMLSMRREGRRIDISSPSEECVKSLRLLPVLDSDSCTDEVRRDEVKSDMRLEDMALRLLMTSVANERI